MFDEVYLQTVIPLLRARGIIFDSGLTEQEVESIQDECRFIFPPDLRMFLHTALPVAYRRDTRFPNWRGDLQAIRQYIDHHTLGIADALLGEYNSRHEILWCNLWGAKPDGIEVAVDRLRDLIRQAPVLIPIYGHRFIPALPEAGNPVYSVVGLDTIYYGYDLASYLSQEFKVPLPPWAATEPRRVEFWHNLVVCNSAYIEDHPEDSAYWQRRD